MNDDLTLTAWNYPQNDIVVDNIDYELVYEASLQIDFSTADPITKLAWVFLVAPFPPIDT